MIYNLFLTMSCCITYLLLHSSYFKTYVLKTMSICYLTISEGQKFRSSLARWLWFRVSHGIVVKLSPRVAPIWRLDWDWRIHFQRSTLTWLECWSWLLAEGLSSSLCGPFGKVARVSCNLVLASLRGGSLRGAGRRGNVLYDGASEIPYHHFSHV